MDDNYVPMLVGGQGRSPRELRDSARTISFFLGVGVVGAIALAVLTWLR